jgi:hypothetical protein
LQKLLGGRSSDQTSTTRSRHQTGQDGTTLTSHLEHEYQRTMAQG